MKSIYKILVFINMACTIFGTNAKAQKGQASGNMKKITGDISINRQVDEQGQIDAVGGITIKDDGSVSFDSRGGLGSMTAGFWSAISGKQYAVRFRDQKGNSYAIIEMQGLVRWDKNRNVSAGKENFLHIETNDNPKVFVEITGRSINTDGELVISTKDGSKYTLSGLSSDFTGTIVNSSMFSIGRVVNTPGSSKSRLMIGGFIVIILAALTLGFVVRNRHSMKRMAATPTEPEGEMLHKKSDPNNDLKQSAPHSYKRNILVTACLIILLIGNLIAASIYVYYFDTDELKQILNASVIIENAPFIMVLLNIVFFIMLLARKIIGFFGVVAIGIIAFLLYIFKGVGFYWFIGPVEIAILFGILQIKRNGISAWNNLK